MRYARRQEGLVSGRVFVLWNKHTRADGRKKSQPRQKLKRKEKESTANPPACQGRVKVLSAKTVCVCVYECEPGARALAQSGIDYLDLFRGRSERI